MNEHIEQLQASILFKCQEHIRLKGPAALEANDIFWQQSCKERQDYHPFNPLNLQAALSRVPKYIECIQHCGVNWIGYHFRFPILWLPSEKYQSHYQLTNREEASAWRQLQTNSGFRAPTDATFSSYCLSNLHCQSQYSDSDSDEEVAWGHATFLAGGDVRTPICTILLYILISFYSQNHKLQCLFHSLYPEVYGNLLFIIWLICLTFNSIIPLYFINYWSALLLT